MARIPADEIERLKSQVKLADLCRDYGIQLRPMGPDTLMGRCPFHDDQDPSFGVTPSKNLWNCLAGCGGGDTLQLVMKLEKVSFRHAAEKLQRRLGAAPSTSPAVVVPAPETITTRRGAKHPILVAPVPPAKGEGGEGGEGEGADQETGINDAALLARVADFYHQTFCNDPKAMKYLLSRHCFTPEAAKVFQIGYANRTLGYRVPVGTRQGRALKAQLTRLGVFRVQTAHEHLNGSVVFPILDEQGRGGKVTQMYGRKITPGLSKGTALHLYLPGEHTAVWNAAALRQQSEWLLCESIIDALTLWCAGFRNVTCAYGVNGFTAAHWKLVEDVKPRRIVVCYDNDAAGNQAAAKLTPELAARGVQVVRAALPGAPGPKDINEVACVIPAGGNVQAALAMVLEGAGNAAAPATRAMTPAALPSLAADPPAAPSSASPSAAAKEKMPTAPTPAAAAPTLPATPVATAVPTTPTTTPPAAATTFGAGGAGGGGELTLDIADRHYRVRGIARNQTFEALKVNLLVSRRSPGTTGSPAEDGGAFYVDTLDLYSARARKVFLNEAARELTLGEPELKLDLGRVLLAVEAFQEQQIAQAQEQKPAPPPTLSETERAAALELLRAPDLLARILADFDRCGIVGETVNKLVGYLAATSRKLEQPLAVVIQSSSAAGKSSLMEAVLALLPPEEVTKYSAMTGQSLFYMGQMDLKHKVLAIVEEEGAERASYALKLLQSEGELTIASTGKDPQTGRMETHAYHVEGPVMIFLTTTAAEVDEELLNRCLVLTVDEDRAQTRAIHALQRQRQTLAGLLAHRDRQAVLALHRNAQRLLQPLLVANPFAQRLTFLDARTRTRRDHMKYLTLIRTLALLHQYQRPRRTIEHPPGSGQTLEYIEVTPADIDQANDLLRQVLGRSLDELAPQTRRLLGLLEAMVSAACAKLKVLRSDYHFTRRQVRESCGWTDFMVRTHLGKLVELEYVLVHRGGRGQSFVYELLYQEQPAAGQEAGGDALGLLDAQALASPARATQNAPRVATAGGVGGSVGGGVV